MRFLAEGEDSRARLAFSHEHAPPALETLPDADIVSPASAQFLRHNGTNWTNSAIQAADLPATTTSFVSMTKWEVT